METFSEVVEKKKVSEVEAKSGQSLPNDCLEYILSYLTCGEFHCVVPHLSRVFYDQVNRVSSTRPLSPYLVLLEMKRSWYSPLYTEDVRVNRREMIGKLTERGVYSGTTELVIEQCVSVPSLSLFPRLRRLACFLDMKTIITLWRLPQQLIFLEEWRTRSLPPPWISEMKMLRTVHLDEERVRSCYLLRLPSTLTSLTLAYLRLDTQSEAFAAFNNLASLVSLRIDMLDIEPVVTKSRENGSLLPFLEEYHVLPLLVATLPRLVSLSLPASLFLDVTSKESMSPLLFNLPVSALPHPQKFLHMRRLHIIGPPRGKTGERLDKFLQASSATLSTLHIDSNIWAGCSWSTSPGFLARLRRVRLDYRYYITKMYSSTPLLLRTIFATGCIRDLELTSVPLSCLSLLDLSPLRSTLTRLVLECVFDVSFYLRKDNSSKSSATNTSSHPRHALDARCIEALERLPVDVPLLTSFFYSGGYLSTVASILARFSYLSRVSLDPYEEKWYTPSLYPPSVFPLLTQLPDNVKHISLCRSSLETIPLLLPDADDPRWHIRDTPRRFIQRCECGEVELSHRWTCPLPSD